MASANHNLKPEVVNVRTEKEIITEIEIEERLSQEFRKSWLAHDNPDRAESNRRLSHSCSDKANALRWVLEDGI